MSLFTLSAPCPIFAPAVGQRAAHILEGRAITINSAGETVLSFVETGAFVGELQPYGGNYVRMLQGVVVQIDAIFYIMGNPDVQVGDRCTLSGAQMEAISTQQYGLEHSEVSLHHIGR